MLTGVSRARGALVATEAALLAGQVADALSPVVSVIDDALDSLDALPLTEDPAPLSSLVESMEAIASALESMPRALALLDALVVLPDHVGLVEVRELATVQMDPRRWRGRRGIGWRSESRDPWGRLTLFGPMPDGWVESLNGFIDLGLAALIAVRIRDRQRPTHLRIVAPVRKAAPSPIRDQHRNACARLAHEEARLAKDPANREALNAAAAWRHIVTALGAAYDVGPSSEVRAVTRGVA